MASNLILNLVEKVFSFNYTVPNDASITDTPFSFGIAGANNDSFLDILPSKIFVKLYNASELNDANYLEIFESA